MVSWVAQQDKEWQLLKGREMGKKDLSSLWLMAFQSFPTPSAYGNRYCGWSWSKLIEIFPNLLHRLCPQLFSMNTWLTSFIFNFCAFFFNAFCSLQYEVTECKLDFHYNKKGNATVCLNKTKYEFVSEMCVRCETDPCCHHCTKETCLNLTSVCLVLLVWRCLPAGLRHQWSDFG